MYRPGALVRMSNGIVVQAGGDDDEPAGDFCPAGRVDHTPLPILSGHSWRDKNRDNFLHGTYIQIETLSFFKANPHEQYARFWYDV